MSHVEFGWFVGPHGTDDRYQQSNQHAVAEAKSLPGRSSGVSWRPTVSLKEIQERFPANTVYSVGGELFKWVVVI